MPRARQRDVVRRVYRRLSETALRMAKAFCTSNQLRRHMVKEDLSLADTQNRGRLFVPEYWAHYYHIGRANFPPIRARNGPFLIWFKDARDDPRLLNGEYPILKSDVVTFRDIMGSDEFKAKMKQWKAEGKIVVSPSSPTAGGSASFPGNRFFGMQPGEGLAPLPALADQIAMEEAETEMKRILQGLPKTVTLHLK